MDESGDIWVTPAGVDKGSLTVDDIMVVRKNGAIEGKHKPSSEFPFHQAIYNERAEVRAIIHAHPPALVSFSIVRDSPNMNVIPQAKSICGDIGYAPYELPGSEKLGQSIAQEFARGFSSVIMENHGTVVGGCHLQDAFERFETLEFSARSVLFAKMIGKPNYLSDQQIQSFEEQYALVLPELDEVHHPSDEREVRADICRIIQRACEQGLMISTYGTVSVRWRENDFLITPRNRSRWDIQMEDVVQIRNGRREPGKQPSRSVKIHQEIYENNPDINAIIITQAPYSMAFSITGQTFNDRTIPESWILLQDIPMLPFGSHFKGTKTISDTLGPGHPVVIIENDSILVSGHNLLHAFDRLEVAEFSARSLIYSQPLGEMKPIGEEQIDELRRKFL